jgi:hypothetical protein
MPGRPRPVSNPFRRSALLSAVAIILLGACASATPTPSPSSLPSAPPVASSAPSSAASVPPALTAPPSTAPTPTAIPAGWQKVWSPASDPATLLAAVIATPDGFVAVGSDRAGQHPAAVSSTDGVAWRTEGIGGDGRTPTTLAKWGDRVLATGAGETPCTHPFGLNTWVRSASGTWREAPFVDLLCHAEEVSIAFLHDRPILVGSGPGNGPVAWSSTDGLHWTDHSAAFTGLLPLGVVSDGRAATLFAQGPTAISTSTTTDGSTWTTPAKIAGTTASLGIDGAFLIDGRPTVITSQGEDLGTLRADGNGVWFKMLATGLTPGDLGTITAFDGGLLATGGNGPGAEAWVSLDGASWRPLELPKALAVNGASVGGVAVRDGRAVLIGAIPAEINNPTSSIWTGPAELLAP